MSVTARNLSIGQGASLCGGTGPHSARGYTELVDRSTRELATRHDAAHHALSAAKVLDELTRNGDDLMHGSTITRLDHALQAATRAYRDGGDADWIVAALLHDIGDVLAPRHHDRFSAEVLRPFVREEVSWVVEHHGIFHTAATADHYDWESGVHEQYRDHIFFQSCKDFCHRWDQASFDPAYTNEPLSTFEPMVVAVFARSPYSPDVIRHGIVKGLPIPSEQTVSPEPNPL